MVLFLCGDVMLGRGIDQILPRPGDPALYEGYHRSALDYVRLAEGGCGPIARPVDFRHVWGDALAWMERMGARVRIINLETAITSLGSPWPRKGIHYRMHPGNAPCLTAAGVDVAVLANNHVLDWGMPGFLETLQTLDRVGIQYAGAGKNLAEAGRPARVQVAGEGQAWVFGFGAESSGIPWEWSASAERPGVLLVDLQDEWVAAAAERVREVKRTGDIAIASIHWGANWGFEVPEEQRDLAHRLIDEAGFDLVHGHSSHHVKGLELHRGSLILYGCGDFITDYEGISGYEEFRPDLALMYFPAWDPIAGRLTGLRMVPLRMRGFRLQEASEEEAAWVADRLDEESRGLGTRIGRDSGGILALDW